MTYDINIDDGIWCRYYDAWPWLIIVITLIHLVTHWPDVTWRLYSMTRYCSIYSVVGIIVNYWWWHYCYYSIILMTCGWRADYCLLLKRLPDWLLCGDDDCYRHLFIMTYWYLFYLFVSIFLLIIDYLMMGCWPSFLFDTARWYSLLTCGIIILPVLLLLWRYINPLLTVFSIRLLLLLFNVPTLQYLLFLLMVWMTIPIVIFDVDLDAILYSGDW